MLRFQKRGLLLALLFFFLCAVPLHAEGKALEVGDSFYLPCRDDSWVRTVRKNKMAEVTRVKPGIVKITAQKQGVLEVADFWNKGGMRRITVGKNKFQKQSMFVDCETGRENPEGGFAGPDIYWRDVEDEDGYLIFRFRRNQPGEWKLIEKTEADVCSYEEKEIRVKDAELYEWRVAGYQRLKNGTFIYTKFNSVTNILE